MCCSMSWLYVSTRQELAESGLFFGRILLGHSGLRRSHRSAVGASDSGSPAGLRVAAGRLSGRPGRRWPVPAGRSGGQDPGVVAAGQALAEEVSQVQRGGAALEPGVFLVTPR